ncbi:MAG TPA: acetyl-CoA carboxylase biotin carboxyl carrier protein [Gemmatimonadales bacterium]|jgi:acetyl-CoA carboxylase biotin carboxyl carrier protein|nr:acetyl-CoA carboxylase biotin carboxyl carrier protein [Gemmatimonadales bacterium]
MNADEMRQLAQLLEKMPGLKSVELKDVKRLAELLRDSPEIGSIEVKGFFGTGIVITRTAQGLAAPMAWAPPAVHAPMPAPAVAGSAAAPAAPAPAAPSHLKEIKSPMVGTFYRAPEPGAEAYAKVGTRVSTGQTVCIIEAMKIMNEIEAEFAGVVTEVCVDDAQPVEFGQVLFRIDPNG